MISFDEEIWKPVKGLEDRYKVSNKGNVKRIARTCIDKRGRAISICEKQIKPYYGEYIEYVLKHEDGKQHMHTGHRLVAEAFIPNPENFPIINHKDENKHNNVVSNLEWCSYSYNVRYKDNNKKISNKLKGKIPSNACRLRWLETGQTFNSKLEACKVLNISERSLNKLLNHKLSSLYKGITLVKIN